MSKSTRVSTTRKPRKPHADFPLFPHASGRWAKKVRGRFVYFGKVSADPKGETALNLWRDQKDDLLAGHTPRQPSDKLTVRELVNNYLTAKRDLVLTAEITGRTFYDYHSTCERVVKAFGKGRIVEDLSADDFAALRRSLAKTRKAIALGNEVQRVRSIFRYGFEAGLIDKPIRCGPQFCKPKRKTLRKERADHVALNGKRMFEAAELRSILKAAGVPLKAAILLGINCGFGASDISSLPKNAIDLEGGWVDFPRPKTGVDRRCPIWPETVKALKEAVSARPRAKNKADDRLAFITKYGQRFVKTNVTIRQMPDGTQQELHTPADALGQEFSKLISELGMKRARVSFYALRHTFETVGGDFRDQIAVNAIMGHADESMAAHYREGIDDDRLRAVANHVRVWLFPSATKTRKAR